MKPYYEHAGITIYHGDCREIVPHIKKFDLILTDPPYPTYMREEYRYYEGIIDWMVQVPQRQLIFWTPAAPFPLDWDGMRVWDKVTGLATFELIYERNGGSGYKIHRYMSPHNRVRARICHDVCNDHPNQKPIQLLADLISETKAEIILDPYCGSGTTLVAAKRQNHQAIGIEIEEKYCEIAAKRLSQEVLTFEEPDIVLPEQDEFDL